LRLNCKVSGNYGARISFRSAGVTALEREGGAPAAGNAGQLIASISQANGKIAEAELQIIQIDQDLRSEVSKDMSEVGPKLSELLEKKPQWKTSSCI